MEFEKKSQVRRNNEVEQQDTLEIEQHTDHPGKAEFSLQNDNFAPDENNYLNEYRSQGDTLQNNEESNQTAVGLELSDGAERDDFINKQTDVSCGGL